MKPKKLLWKLLRSYIFIISLSLITLTWYATTSLKQLYFDQVREELETKANLISTLIRQHLLAEENSYIHQFCQQLGHASSTRITVISPLGIVIGDTDENPETMDNHFYRPEVLQALRGGIGASIRFSSTLNKNLMYVAIPIKKEYEIVGVVRTSVPVMLVQGILKQVYIKIIITGLIIAILAVLLSLVISRRITQPLRELQKSAVSFSQGNFSEKIHISKTFEIEQLAATMNQMAEQLDERIRTILRQRNEQEAILKSMVEGVIAIDLDERIISMNNTAAKMLKIQKVDVHGMSIPEVIRNVDLQRFVNRTLISSEPVEGEIVFHEEIHQYFQAHGTTLNDSSNNVIGAVVVLNDVTHLKRLENIRRDFVANVSHELKTPVTSIKGFVETLCDGAIESRDEARHFLTIISKQVDRLNSIIEDLLVLSRIEQQGEQRAINFEEHNLCSVINSALQVCQHRANDKEITFRFDGNQNISASVNPDILEQAFVNLLDNAINYSEKGSVVEIECLKNGQEVVISFKDSGCGIAPEHIPRLFERFYRVDKARSRKQGGTGLGLAIVKHIAQVHHGSVHVESQPGVGSTFSIHIPLQTSST